jgi:cell wall-associated NlpC family hydrolase
VQPRRPGRRLRAVAAGVLSVVFALAMTGQAQADPTVAEVEAQLDAMWREAEPLIEQYNAVHEEFVRNQTRQAELAAALAPLEAELSVAQERIGEIAARAYVSGQADMLNAMLSTEAPGELADQLVYLDSLARIQTASLRAVVEAKAAYDEQKAPVDALVTQLSAQDAELSTRRAEIESRLDELQALRIQAYGSTGGTGDYRPWVCPAEYLPTPGYLAAAFACAQAGKPYVWGAAGPDYYDCSGLTLDAWQEAGVYLPHNAAAQRRSMTYVDRANLQIGDLVFYYSDLSHVSIYVGDGKVMSAPRSGDVVRMVNMETGAPIHSFGRP